MTNQIAFFFCSSIIALKIFTDIVGLTYYSTGETVDDLCGSSSVADHTSNVLGERYMVVHCGPPKTGSSSLQIFFGKRTDVLNMDNYRTSFQFPSPTAKPNVLDVKNVAVVPACLGPPPHTLVNGEKIDCIKVQQYLKEFEEESTRLNQNILLSSERFSHNIDLEKFQFFFQGYEIRYVFVYRRFYEWIFSYHNQISKFKPVEERMRFVDWLPRVLNQTISQYLSLFSASRYLNLSSASLSYLDMHNSNLTLLQQLFCNHIPNTPHTCRYVTVNSQSQVELNRRSDLDAEFVLNSNKATRLFNLSSYNKSEKLSLEKFVRKDLQSKIEQIKECLPSSIQEQLLRVTLETEILVKKYNQTSLSFTEVKNSCQEALRFEFCSINVDKYLNLYSTADHWEQTRKSYNL